MEDSRRSCRDLYAKRERNLRKTRQKRKKKRKIKNKRKVLKIKIKITKMIEIKMIEIIEKLKYERPELKIEIKSKIGSDENKMKIWSEKEMKKIEDKNKNKQVNQMEAI